MAQVFLRVSAPDGIFDTAAPSVERSGHEIRVSHGHPNFETIAPHFLTMTYPDLMDLIRRITACTRCLSGHSDEATRSLVDNELRLDHGLLALVQRRVIEVPQTFDSGTPKT